MANRDLVHLYHHLVSDKGAKEPSWEERYFTDKEIAQAFPTTLPPTRMCRHAEPCVIAALRDANTGLYYRLSNKMKIDVQ
jgi:hypothetical protein